MNFIKNLLRFPFSYIKKHKRITAGVIVLLIIIYYFFIPKQPVVIATQKVEPSRFIQSISVSGQVDALESADLTFQLGGKLVYLGVKKGDKVSAGQTIGVLDQRTAQKNLQAALIDYSKQRVAFEQTRDQNLDRTPQQALNDQMKVILENNQFDLDKSVNSVELQDLAKQQSVLTSPISGIVTRADVKTAGLTVVPTTTFTVVNPDTMVFKIDVDQADVSKVKEGQVIKVNLDAYPNDEIQVKVDSIDFTTHATSTGGNAYTIQANLPLNPKFDYRVGMEGNAEIITAQEENVLSVPISTLTETNDVYVKTKTGYERRKIELGIENDTDVVVTKGLSSGDNVVLDPSLVPQKKQGKFLGLF